MIDPLAEINNILIYDLSPAATHVAAVAGGNIKRYLLFLTEPVTSLLTYGYVSFSIIFPIYVF
jgi:hypothetical protein